MIRLIRLLLALAVVGGLIWTYAPFPSRPLVYQEENFQCQIPYNWTLKATPQFVLQAHRLRGGTISFAAKPVPLTFRVDSPIFSDAIKSHLASDGAEFLSESREPFQGHVAYAYTMRKTIRGFLIYTHSVNFAVGNFRYDIVTSKREADPTQDAQLQDAANSFALINSASN